MVELPTQKCLHLSKAFTAKLYDIYANNPESCIQLMGYLAENPNERKTLEALLLNEKAFKLYADALLQTIKSNSESKLWKYFAKNFKKSRYAITVATCGVTGTICCGPWGAPSGVVVGEVVEVVWQHLRTDNKLSQDLKDAYVFLGISPNATNEEVDKAYREKSRIYHPDKCGATEAQTQLNACVELIRSSRGNKANHDEFEIV